MGAFGRFVDIAEKLESVLAEEGRMIRAGSSADERREISDVKAALTAGLAKALGELKSGDHSLLAGVPSTERQSFAEQLSKLQTAMVENEGTLRRSRRTARKQHRKDGQNQAFHPSASAAG